MLLEYSIHKTFCSFELKNNNSEISIMKAICLIKLKHFSALVVILKMVRYLTL